MKLGSTVQISWIIPSAETDWTAQIPLPVELSIAWLDMQSQNN